LQAGILLQNKKTSEFLFSPSCTFSFSTAKNASLALLHTEGGAQPDDAQGME
jgi:hypothetical protein